MLNELAAHYQIAPATLSNWNRQFQERAAEIFRQGPSDSERQVGDIDPLYMIDVVDDYIHIYNVIRPHASLGELTPNAVCQQQSTVRAA